jgi:hypothetical protein
LVGVNDIAAICAGHAIAKAVLHTPERLTKLPSTLLEINTTSDIIYKRGVQYTTRMTNVGHTYRQSTCDWIK